MKFYKNIFKIISILVLVVIIQYITNIIIPLILMIIIWLLIKYQINDQTAEYPKNNIAVSPATGIIYDIINHFDGSYSIFISTNPIIHDTGFSHIYPNGIMSKTINQIQYIDQKITVQHLSMFYSYMYNEDEICDRIYGYAIGPCSTIIHLPKEYKLTIIKEQTVIMSETMIAIREDHSYV